jgi:hypothetical protein
MCYRSVRHLVMLVILMALATPTLAGEHECLSVTVCFTPGGNCTDAIVQALQRLRRLPESRSRAGSSAVQPWQMR